MKNIALSLQSVLYSYFRDINKQFKTTCVPVTQASNTIGPVRWNIRAVREEVNNDLGSFLPLIVQMRHFSLVT